MGKGGSSQTPACELAPRPLLTTDTSPAPAFPHQLIFVISNHPGAPHPACKLGVGYGTLAWKGLRVHGPALAGMGSTLTFVFGKLWVPPWLSLRLVPSSCDLCLYPSTAVPDTEKEQEWTPVTGPLLALREEDQVLSRERQGPVPGSAASLPSTSHIPGGWEAVVNAAAPGDPCWTPLG